MIKIKFPCVFFFKIIHRNLFGWIILLNVNFDFYRLQNSVFISIFHVSVEKYYHISLCERIVICYFNLSISKMVNCYFCHISIGYNKAIDFYLWNSVCVLNFMHFLLSYDCSKLMNSNYLLSALFNPFAIFIWIFGKQIIFSWQFRCQNEYEFHFALYSSVLWYTFV